MVTCFTVNRLWEPGLKPQSGSIPQGTPSHVPQPHRFHLLPPVCSFSSPSSACLYLGTHVCIFWAPVQLFPWVHSLAAFPNRRGRLFQAVEEDRFRTFRCSSFRCRLKFFPLTLSTVKEGVSSHFCRPYRQKMVHFGEAKCYSYLLAICIFSMNCWLRIWGVFFVLALLIWKSFLLTSHSLLFTACQFYFIAILFCVYMCTLFSVSVECWR